jgi:diguanylate cyclase (GGDEF)-like protein/PAS domain S-box-containing protein
MTTTVDLAFLADALDDASDGIALARFGSSDDDLMPVWLNAAYERRTGYSREELIRCGLRLLFGPETDSRTMRLAIEYMRRGEPIRVRTTLYRKDGVPYAADIQGQPVTRPEPGTHVLLVDRDITGDQASASAMRDFAAHANRVRRLHDVVATSRGEAHQIGKILEFAAEDLGFRRGFAARLDENEVVFRAVIDGGPTPPSREWIMTGERLPLAEAPGMAHAAEAREIVTVNDLRRSGRGLRSVGEGWRGYIVAPVIAGDEVWGFVGFLSERDRSTFSDEDRDFMRLVAALVAAAVERGERERRLDTLAFYDALTGLPNRVLLDDRLTQTIASSRRHNRDFALHMLDLDGFKAVNDTGGHAAGDSILKIVGRRLLNVLRESDTLARLGGDEFVVVQPAIESRDDAERLAQRLIDAVDTPFVANRREYKIGLSVGIVISEKGGQPARTLMHSADAALYAAKQAGRGTYRVFEPAEE